MFDVAVIGCGVIGASVAYELSRYRLSVAILEKENDVACGTTRANSAIVHAGYDPTPGTKMARLNVAGSKMMEGVCRDLSVKYKRIGSLVVAFNKADEDILRGLYHRGEENGVEGLRLLGAKETLAMEPNLNPRITGSLYAPTAAVVDPWGLCIAMAQTAVRNGARLHLSCKVEGIDSTGDFYRIRTSGGVFEARYVVNAAGTFADVVNNMAAKPFFRILPVKGEYYLLDKSQGGLVGHTVFQPPTQGGKGVLISPTVHGNLIVGPTADPALGPEDTAVTSDGLQKVASASLRACAKVDFRESIRNFSGVRATTETDDFILGAPKDAPHFINAAAIKSPGISAAPAIGPEVRKILEDAGLECNQKATCCTTREQTLFKNMDERGQAEAIRRDPRYGRVVCRCETITEGDIVHVLHSPIPPVSVDGVKRRCGTGMGRCQGGFCGPRVHAIVSRETGIPMEQVCQDRAGSRILVGRTKSGGGSNGPSV